MKKINNYSISEQIYEDGRSLIYRGYRSTDQRDRVVLKILNREYPTPQELASFRREYETAKRLQDVNGVITVYGLENYQHSLMIVMEDFGGESLTRWQSLFGMRLSADKCLHLAIRLAEILDQIHHRKIIHKDINPSNIVWNRDTDQVKIIDFGIATDLSKETVGITAINALEGTLPYISPEQTGRMNRSVDFRSDLYSFGVTLYELLTGRLPFKTRESAELVHAHIAVTPVEPYRNNETIPLVLSKIIMKLLAKNAEDRYQSDLGLKYDLERCLEQLLTTGGIADFEIGGKDFSDKLRISQKLYGRQFEISKLLEAFQRVCQGTNELLLVTGYSGIGKTLLVREVHKPIVAKKGYFISGKFDQYKRNIPYSALIEAFQNLIWQILTESKDKLATWKQRLEQALSINGQLMIDIIPDLSLIIDSCPPVANLTPFEAQNRFNLVFQNFVNVFAQNEHPLVLFLDDLQWADSATLKLIQLLINNLDFKHLLLIGAYRDNEVDALHPLTLSLKEIQANHSKMSFIILENLGLNEFVELAQDSFQCSKEKAEPLARLCYSKT